MLAASLPAADAQVEQSNFADLSLEELASIRITSVSKKAESLADAPASIFVITGEDIRRSGAVSLPEVLRLAPNLQVSRIDARNYAIAARGFNGAFANKLLVLIDGRTVYSPLFSGVYWDAQDVVLEDVERVEVVSGPGATLWGANAVNGVINIMTRPANASQGTLIAAGAGSRQTSLTGRHGGALDNGGHYRVYAKRIETDDPKYADNTASAATGWRRSQTGFRTDWTDAGRSFTLQGDAYSGRLRQQGTQEVEIAGANLNGRVQGRIADGSEVSLQTYWDYTRRDQPNALAEDLHTIDIDFQHALKPGGSHQVIWGAAYRSAMDDVRNGRVFTFLPASVRMHWTSLFAQDEIRLRPDLRLTAGLKMENTSYTGTEALPTLRLAWHPAADSLVWGSASRAVRAPSRIDRDFFIPAQSTPASGIPRYAVAGGPAFQSEVANVYEIGYRAQPNARLTYSATLYYGFYEKMRTLERNFSGESIFANRGEARTRGIETWGNFQATPSWRLSGGFTLQRIIASVDPGSTDQSVGTGLASNDPGHHWMLRSSVDIDQRRDLDVTLRRVGALRMPAVPGYTALDMRFGWRLSRTLEFSVVAQNLLDRAHPEFGASGARSEIERSVFLKLLWRV